MNDTLGEAWAFRLIHRHTETDEQLVGIWHRTSEWVRCDGIYTGVVSVCNRAYNGGFDSMEMIDLPNVHPVGSLCMGCFGIGHSDKVLAD